MPRKLWPVALLLPLAVAGCHHSKPPADDGKPPEVMVSTPVTDSIVNYEVFTGRTQAANRVDLKARVSGFLDKVYVGRDDERQDGRPMPVKEGEDVAKGAVLFVIEQKPYRDALTQAEKTYDQLVSQRDYNRRNLDRLRTSGVASSPTDIDAAATAVRTSEAQAEAALAAKKIAQQNLDWCTVTAPFDGRISTRLVDRGNVVKADDTILATLEQVNPLRAYFDVDERTTLRISPLLDKGKVPPDAARKFPVTLGLANEEPDKFSHPGVLKSADNKVDPGTGTLRMWGLFENPKLDLKSGMFIRVRMGVGEPQGAVFVAEAALQSDQGRQYVYVLDEDNRVVYTPVEPGQRKNGLIAVRSLKGDERVIVDGLQRVRPKMVAAPKEVPMPRATDEAGH
jgi:multidrug efflux system membrane fusion protein